jgi:hypothetical protein
MAGLSFGGYGSAGLAATRPGAGQRIAGTVDPARPLQLYGLNAGPAEATYHNPAYGSNTQQTEIQARPDGTYLQTQRTWDPATGTYRTLGSQTGGHHQRTITRGAGAGGTELEDLDLSDFDAAGNKIPKIPPRELKPPKADRTAAEAAAYGRAKDQIGLNAAAGLKAMQGLMASRGISGSGIEAALSQGIVGDALGGLGEVSRDQAIQGLQRDYAVEDRNLAADVTQRGQDVSALTARNRDIMALMELTRGRRRTGGITPETTVDRWAY